MEHEALIGEAGKRAVRAPKLAAAARKIVLFAGTVAASATAATATPVDAFEYHFGIQELVLSVTSATTGQQLLFAQGAIPAPGTGYVTNKGTNNNPDHQRTDILFNATDVTYYSNSNKTSVIGHGTYSFNGWWGETDQTFDSQGRPAYSFGPGGGTLTLTDNPLGNSSIDSMSMPAGYAPDAPTWQGELGRLFGSDPRDGYVSFSDFFAGDYTTGIAEHSWWVGTIGDRIYHIDLHGYNGQCKLSNCGTAEVPEPASMLLLGIGMAGFLPRRKRA